MDFKKTLTVEVNQKGVSSTANALGKLAEKAAAVDKPLWYAKNTLEHFNGLKLNSVTLEIKGVVDQVRQFNGNVKGLGELASGMKGLSGSFTSVATAAERLVSSTSGLDLFNTKLQAIRDTLQSMQGLSGTLTGISKVPDGVTIRGGGTGGSTADPDKALATAQKRFVGDVTRQYIVKTQGPAAYLEQKAAILGVTKETGPMIAALRATEKQMQGVGMSSKATAQAMRMVPAQMTDIVTQLAGGQSPFLIMIQQGGQMRDMFGGFGPMLKNVGGMLGRFVTSAVGMFSMLAAAAGLVAYAFVKGRSEAEEFTKALSITGNYAGMTKNSFLDMQASLKDSAGNASKASEAMTALASTGKLTGDVISSVSGSLSRYSKATGTDVEKLAEQYASLAKDPVNGLLRLNEGTNFLTVSTYEQVKALQQQGNTLEATRVAALALAEGQDQVSKAVVMNAGYMTRAYTSFKETLSDVWDLMKSIGREKSATMAAQDLESTLAFYKKKYELGRLNASGIQKMNELEKESSEKSGVTAAGMGRVDFLAKQNAQRQIALQADVKLDQIAGKSLSRQGQMEKSLKELRSLWEALPETSEKKTTSWLKAQEDAIREQYKEKGGGFKAADTRLATLKAEQDALQQNLAGLQEQGSSYENVTEHAKRLLAVQNLLATSGGKKEQIAALKQEEYYLTNIVEIEKQISKAKDENTQIKAQQDLAASIEVTSQSIQDQIAYLKESGAVSDTRTKIEKDLAKAKADANNESLSITVRHMATMNTLALERVDNEDKYAKSLLKANEAKLQANQADIENANTLATLAESQQKEVEWLSLSNKEREKAQALWNIEVEARKKIVEIEKQKKGLAGNEEAIADKNRQIEGIRQTVDAQISLVQAFEKTKDSGLSFYGDTKVAAKNWLDSIPTQQQEIQSVFSSTYSSMAEVMGSFITTGKANWGDFAKSVMTTISQLLIKIAILKTAQAAAGLMDDSDFASTEGNSSSIGAMAAGYGAGRGGINAQGNAFTMSGVAAFATGGAFTNSVVNSPTMFAFASGGIPSMGVIGEKPGSVGEAVMPLTRDRKGDLAVKTTGGAGVQNNVSVNVNVSGDTSSSQVTSEQGGKALGEAVSRAVQAELIKQSRSGGILDRSKQR